jgi:hypothetical protein
VNTSDQDLWNQLAESAIGRAAGAGLRMVTAARSSSVAAHWLGDASAEWSRLELSTRWRLISVLLVSAVLTHVGLMALRQPAGWLWLVIPGIAAGFAVLLVALSGSAGRAGLSE